MLCQKCGKEIPIDSTYCMYCSCKVEDHITSKRDAPTMFCMSCGRLITDGSELCPECKNNPSSRFVAPTDEISYKYNTFSDEAKINASMGNRHSNITIAIVFLVMLVCIGLPVGVYLTNTTNQSTPASANVSSVMSSSSKATIDRETIIKRLSSSIAKDAERNLKDYLKYPDTASIDYSACTLEYHKAYYISKGILKYTNNQRQEVEKPFEVGMYANKTYTFCVYVVLNENVLMDDRYLADDNGIALKDFYMGDDHITKGEPILDNLINIDEFINSELYGSSTASYNNTTSSSDGKITLDAYNQIETGMSYEEACDIVGSNGSVMSETDIAGYHTYIVMWYGHGSIGANANITIQNDKVFAKAQFGLS